MIDHNHFICHFIFGGHLLNIPRYGKESHLLYTPKIAGRIERFPLKILPKTQADALIDSCVSVG